MLELCVWYDPAIHVRELLVSDLNTRIEALLAASGIDGGVASAS